MSSRLGAPLGGASSTRKWILCALALICSAEPSSAAGTKHHSATGDAGFKEYRDLASALQESGRTFPVGPMYFGAPDEIGAEREPGEILLVPVDYGALDVQSTPAPSIDGWKETGSTRSFLLRWPPGRYSYSTEFLNPTRVHVECNMPLLRRRSHLIFGQYLGPRKFTNVYGEVDSYHTVRAFAAASGNVIENIGGQPVFIFAPETVFSFDDSTISKLKKTRAPHVVGKPLGAVAPKEVRPYVTPSVSEWRREFIQREEENAAVASPAKPRAPTRAVQKPNKEEVPANMTAEELLMFLEGKPVNSSK